MTGAAGFIGSRLVRQLLDAGRGVLAIDDFSGGWPERLPDHPRFEFHAGDVAEVGGLEALLCGAGPVDAVVHLAARVGVRAVLRDPEGCRSSNLRGVREILRAVQALPSDSRPRVLAASSSEVYAESFGALAEGDATRRTDAVGRWAYAASKLRGEEILDEARALWPTSRRPVHLRFFNVAGPGQDSESGMVLPTFVERALRGEPLPVHGDGSQVRTFAHVDEVGRILRRLVEHPSLPAGALNVGGRARTSIRDLAACVVRAAATTSAIEFTDPRRACGSEFEEIRFREPALERLRTLGLEEPNLSLEAIVADTVRRHPALIRPRPRSARGTTCVSPAS